MPPKKKTSRAEIVDAVIALTDLKGWEVVTARSVAYELNISTQPIYHEFRNMEELKAEAVKRGFDRYVEFVKERARRFDSPALGQSVAYVRFATTHPNLFKLLFGSKSLEYDSLDDMSRSIIEDTGIIKALMKITGLSEDKTYALHLRIWMAIHGLACMASSNTLKITDEEIAEFTKEITIALTGYYKTKE